MKALLLLFLPISLFAQAPNPREVQRWQRQAKQVTIIRDSWGIPHVYGRSDADAVFGLLYAQCEDDFKRVEMNYIEKLGRKSELVGPSALYDDLYLKLVIDSAAAVKDYRQSPLWMQQLLNAFADGINFYLYTHPEVQPALLRHFEPWYALMWTDGSIGAISTGDITARDVEALYTGKESPLAANDPFKENTSGSNGFAVAPSRAASGNALLYINPHVTFYYRPEVHMVSEAGLNAYGAVTWGQFFVYQGFNEYCGWMHTSSNVDVADMYRESIVQKKQGLMYEYEKKWLPVEQLPITIRVKQNEGFETRHFTALITRHGPVMAKRNGQLLSVKSFNRSLRSLVQSWQRTKAKGFEDYKKNMSLLANTSNSTVFADNKGNIAYWHGNFVPRRNPHLNWAKAVDGTIVSTDWKGLHSLDEIIHVYNPASGWIQNCNSTPFTAAGASSPRRENFPAYMAPDGENFRAINAARLLGADSSFTLDKIIAAGYDRKLSCFEILIPALLGAFDKAGQQPDSTYQMLRGPIDMLRKWDYYSAENSIATTLAIHWGEKLTPSIRRVYIDEGEDDQVTLTKKYVAEAPAAELLGKLSEVVDELKQQFGTWQVPWGELNRYQRVSNAIDQQYDDAKHSEPVPFASSSWGMLPAYNSRYFPGTRKRYGVSGNSFVCAVEFGKRVRAKSLLAGGESGNILSPHFQDQLRMYTTGNFKEVLFYKEDVLKDVERKYHPGD